MFCSTLDCMLNYGPWNDIAQWCGRCKCVWPPAYIWIIMKITNHTCFGSYSQCKQCMSKYAIKEILQCRYNSNIKFSSKINLPDSLLKLWIPFQVLHKKFQAVVLFQLLANIFPRDFFSCPLLLRQVWSETSLFTMYFLSGSRSQPLPLSQWQSQAKGSRNMKPMASCEPAVGLGDKSWAPPNPCKQPADHRHTGWDNSYWGRKKNNLSL